MKRLMILAAAVVMMFGAKGADINSKFSYTWSIDITGLSSTYDLPQNLSAYLMDSTGVILANLTLNMFDKTYNLNEDVANSVMAASNYDIYYTDGSINTSTDERTGALSYHLTTTFKRDEGLATIYSNAPGEEAKDKSLQVVLQGKNATTGETKQQIVAVNWSNNNNFSANAVYAPTPPTTNVPEPTSGLLMLLGMAGLALKRKRI